MPQGTMRDRLDALAQQLRTHEPAANLDRGQRHLIVAARQRFNHTASVDVSAAGVGANGIFPALAYRDTWIYVTTCQAVWYRSDPTSGLREIDACPAPATEFTWLAGSRDGNGSGALDDAFATLSGLDTLEAIKASDYRELKDEQCETRHKPAELRRHLLRPEGGDAGNLAVQFRATAELGMALRLLRGEPAPELVLVAGTLSLPLVRRANASLFYEHLKRLCCVEARSRGTAFIAASRSYRTPEVEMVEEIVRETEGDNGEHWYLRLPSRERDGWEISGSGGSLPPPGAITYLARFHRSSPITRIDMDERFWGQRLQGKTEDETRARERRLFETLDFLGHDQRSYGYPRPLAAAQQRAALSKSETHALRARIIDASMRAGLGRAHFRELRPDKGEG